MINDRDPLTPLNTWRPLVRVCRRWRCLVFTSPRRLNLRLAYNGHGPISEMLDAWPVLPIALMSRVKTSELPKSDQWGDNLVAALESEHYNRISEIHISETTNSRWERFVAAMQRPFPGLTHMDVSVYLFHHDLVPVLPDSFLGGSAPRLRKFSLTNVPFPSLPKLLLSVNGLINLVLSNIPDSGYISPDAMATALTMMTRLESLHLQFRSPLYLPEPTNQYLPPSTRFILPALTELLFGGVSEYLEDLLARIDAPLLYDLYIIFSEDSNFDVPQLGRLIGLAEDFKAFDHTVVSFLYFSIMLDFKTEAVDHLRRRLVIEINCTELDMQLSSLAQLCSSSFPLISAFEGLKITEYKHPLSWKDDTDDTRWMELLNPFTAVKDLYLMDQIARHVCGALRELSRERVTEVLPSLRNVFVDGSRSFELEQIEEAMRPFVAARQLSGHLVAIDHWRR